LSALDIVSVPTGALGNDDCMFFLT